MKGKFKEWLNANRLTEARGNPLKKLRDVEQDDGNILICCDWLQDREYDTKPINVKDMAYIKPLDNRFTEILKKRFPSFVVVRKASGMMPKSTYYTMFNRDLLETAFDFLHISKAQHIKDDIYFSRYDCCRNLSKEEIQDAGRRALSANKESFSGKWIGPGSVPRARLDPDIWNWDQARFLAEIVPHEEMRNGIAFNERGLVSVMQIISQTIMTKWGVEVGAPYLIDQRL